MNRIRSIGAALTTLAGAVLALAAAVAAVLADRARTARKTHASTA
jgi:hypothetical protein